MFILLSSVLFYHLAFFFPDRLGWGILLSFVLLFAAIDRDQKWGALLLKSFLWGILVYGIHFYWLLYLLAHKSKATGLTMILSYLVVLAGFALPTFGWLSLTGGVLSLLCGLGRVVRFFVFTLSSGVYAWYLANYSLLFLGAYEGYPLASWGIPLARYGWFYQFWLILCSLLGGSIPSLERVQRAPIRVEQAKSISRDYGVLSYRGKTIVHLKPDGVDEVPSDPAVTGQRIQQKLASISPEYKSENAVIVAPESTFPFVLTDYREIVDTWLEQLGAKTQLILGSQRTSGEGEEKQWHQSLYWLSEGRIKKYYDKHHRVMFVEHVPEAFKEAQWAKGLFLGEKRPIEVPQAGEHVPAFVLQKDFVLLPRMCSELFVRSGLRHLKAQLADREAYEGEAVLWLVNDSWFMPTVRAWLVRLASLRAFELKKPVIYVTHDTAQLFSREG